MRNLRYIISLLIPAERMNQFKSLWVTIFLFALFSSANATVINVPADYSTIQAGIDAAVDGDTILVGAGTYNENIQISIDITIHSTQGVENTIIDGGGGTGFDILQDSPGELKGFTITNCDKGVSVFQSRNYLISDCIIQNSSTAISSIARTELKLSNNLIINNTIGLHQDYYGLLSFMDNCTFYGNSSYDLYWNPYWTTEAILIRNTIYCTFLKNISLWITWCYCW